MSADKVVDMEVDMVADMVADIDIEIDMEMQFGERVGLPGASSKLYSCFHLIWLFLFVAMLFLFSILNPIIFLLPCQLFS